MSACASCKTENPAGSKFCAGCGAALPKTPLNIACPSCGAASPEGSRFCKGCGKPIGAAPPPPPPLHPGWGRTPSGPAAARPAAPGQAIQRIKSLLLSGTVLYVIAIFLMYSQVSQLRAMFGAYAGAYTNSGLLWFLIVLDAALAALNVYAVSLVGKGEHKYAKWLFAAMGVLGIIFLLRGLSGPVIYILLNAGLLAAGVWGWTLLSRVEKGLAA